jgi:hypothetical protein
MIRIFVRISIRWPLFSCAGPGEDSTKQFLIEQSINKNFPVWRPTGHAGVPRSVAGFGLRAIELEHRRTGAIMYFPINQSNGREQTPEEPGI